MSTRAALRALAAAGLLAAGAGSGLGQSPPQVQPPAAPAPPSGEAGDAAFGAYQRGLYVTAFREATQRIAADPNDAAAMTLLGEIYSQGLGVKQDWARAAEWYRLAAARKDPHAAFALAMILADGKTGKPDPQQSRRLLEAAAEAVPAAAYHLGLALLRETTSDAERRAVELFRRAAEGGDVDAEYGLAVLYKEGRGVARDPAEAARWMAKAAQDRSISAQVEYAVMLFNGDGVKKDETAAARMFLRAAERGNPIAQNRIARIYAAGRGLPKDLVEAAKWHSLAARQGLVDPWLDDATRALSPAERERADAAARRWIGN